MSESDLMLIKKAFETDLWGDISDLEIQAESDETRQILKDRKNHLYRKEEAFANQL